MLYKLDKYDINVLEKAKCSTGNYKTIKIGEEYYIEVDELIETIDKLNYEVDRLIETYKELEEDVRENYIRRKN